MRLLKLPIRRIKALAFSPDGAELAAGGTIPDRGGFGLWVSPVGDPAAGRHGMEGQEVFGLRYTPAGRLLVAAYGGLDDENGGLYLLDPARPTELPAPLPMVGLPVVEGERVLGVGLSSNRRSDYFVCRRVKSDGTTAPVWEAACASLHGYVAALLPNGGAVTLGHDGYSDHAPPTLSLTLRDAGGRPLATVIPPGHTPGPLVPSPDGERVVLNAGTSLFVWRVHDFAAPPTKIVFGRKRCVDAAFAPDGRLLAAGNDGTVRRLDAATGATVSSHTFTAGKMRSLAVSPDGLTAAVGTERATVVLFDLD